MKQSLIFFLIPIIAGALWLLFIHSPALGRVVIALYIVLLPEAILAAAWLAKWPGNDRTF